MKKLVLALVVSLVGFISLAQAQKGPEIKFDETAHNFGPIEEGPEYKYQFTFTNTGDQPLTINNVATPCGCTTPHFTKDPILPGKKGEINVSYNSAGRMGAFDKTLTVQTNLGAGKDVYLNIKGEVKEKGSIPKVEEKPVVKEPVKETPAPTKKSKKHKKSKATSSAPAPTR